MASALYDRTAHEPLTETHWDPARAEEGIAAIVADAETSVADGVWPKHRLDHEEGDPPAGLRRSISDRPG